MVADFHKKVNSEFFSRQLMFKTIGIIFLLVVLVLAVADYKIYQKKKELAAQIIIYQKEISDIKNSSQTLKNEIANSNNTDYLEKLGYEQFNETKPGETEYMFVKPGDKTKPAAVKQNFWDVKSWLSNAWQWIKSRF